MYTPLTVKTDFSFFEGTSKVKDIIKKAKDSGAFAVALTDRENMFGAYQFSVEAKSQGIQPIIGCQLPITFDEEKRRYGYVVLLAQNEVGYQNICRLMTDAQCPDAKKLIKSLSSENLKKYNEGVILLTGADDGLLVEMLRLGEEDKAKKTLKFLSGVFKDRLYVQINRSSEKRDQETLDIEDVLISFASDNAYKTTRSDGTVFNGIPMVATAEVRYVSKDRHDAYEIMRAIQTKNRVDLTEGEAIVRQDSNDYHYRSYEEMIELFKDIPHALENTNHLACRCAFVVDDRAPILPPFPSEDGRTEIDELRAQSEEGLKERLKHVEGLTDERIKEYEDRLAYELGVIEGMGFPGYFLIVSDFIKWAKKNDIPVGPGRGSGAGSMVAWALLITDLDPFEYGLLFERFLNPERVSMPDFDIDICMLRRDEVIAYVREKYGTANVSQINTFGEMKSKTALKDAARVLMHPEYGVYGFNEINELTKIIPNKDGAPEPQTLADAYQNSEEFRGKINSSPKMKILFDKAQKIQSLWKSTGQHAAGVIIGDRPLSDLIPMRWDDESGMPVTQYNMKGSENVGLVKFDFLGLKTLSVIKETLDNIKFSRGEEIDISKIDVRDKGVYEMLANAKSIGVFQLESAGMQEVLRQVKPTNIEDLVAVVSLFRPGPMEQIPLYAACKNGKETPKYPQPEERTKPFLEETFGIMIYQEQVMRVAQEVAGYSLGAADLLRRAMGKKIASEMDAQRKMFVEGAVERGTPAKDANQLFDTIAKFAGYGFNKSHAAAYAYIAYQTAWLKHHYPAEFLAALMSFEKKEDRLALIREDLTTFGVEMLPPDINKSFPRFTPEPCRTSTGGQGVRFGFNAIKGVSGEMEAFIAERKKGEYKSLNDFAKRAGTSLNKAQLEKLAQVGAYDAFDSNRHRAFQLVNWHMKNEKRNAGQVDMFSAGLAEDIIPESITGVQEWGNRQDREFNSVGFYFNKHPIDHYRSKLDQKGVKTLQDHLDEMLANNQAQLWDVHLCAMVDFAQTKYTRGKKLYLSTKMSEKGRTYNSPLFGGAKSQDVVEALNVANAARENRMPVIIRANVALEDGERVSVFARELISIETYLGDVHGAMTVTVDMQQILDLPETSSMRIKAYEDHDKGLITKAEYEAVLQQANVKKTGMRIQALKAFLDEIKVDDEAEKNAVKISLQLTDNGKMLERRSLPDKYRMTAPIESRLKAFDGVVGVQETF
ncbi:DNA polymerase III subunit alpha [Sulfitobacter sp. R18_1]|uniref:DNA polymerase III subunit alpha n=1 Tax=Sulfitobacter sp. R18_1 TaxID=2821104 RepID=UPI001ADB9879|nr:DNA polymerase III subunit alpha [Sulfitobacter sp. R18_1]MBO9428517.1 DNA polymerase III subunit alpha [Sulfitobacter sp. R18_1]